MLPMRRDRPYLGVSESLMHTLVDVYFDNAYNAKLLLHKEQFLESLAEGTVEAHLILGVCAYAANFYRDQNGEAPLRDHGFMIEWAKRAGALVFQDAESLCADNIATFCILATFWYGQGLWRLSYLHKANACNLVHIAGISFMKQRSQNPLDSELQRRRFWACYLMHCALMENPASFEPIANISNLPLPCAEVDFIAGVAPISSATLENGRSGASICAELVRGFKLWSAVFALVKFPESSITERFTKIYALDDALANWWSTVNQNYKLTCATLSDMPQTQLLLALLLNVVYHQSICALHASVVPLFSWTPSDNSWASARQASAQKSYEHASTVSHLLATCLTAQPNVPMPHSFLAYAAYSGCAVQIPFTWSSNLVIKKRATTNVSNNMRMIQSMAPYWKFAALVQKQFSSLYRIHARCAVDLENEPKDVNINKFLDFKINAADARVSILGFTEILRSKEHGYTNPGEESNDLGIQDGSDNETVPQMSEAILTDDHENENNEGAPDADMNETANSAISRATNLPLGDPTSIHPMAADPVPLPFSDQTNNHHYQTQLIALPPYVEELANGPPVHLDVERQSSSYDIWPPFFHPTMTDILPDNSFLSSSQVGLGDSIDLDYFEPEHWFTNFARR